MRPSHLLLSIAVVVSFSARADDPPTRPSALDAVRSLAEVTSNDRDAEPDKKAPASDDAPPSRIRQTVEQRRREQSELRKQQQEIQLREREHYNNLSRLVRTLGTRDEERAIAAMDELLAIRDPHAIRPLVFVMFESDEALRRTLLEVVGSIRHPHASAALAFVAAVDDSADVRQQALDMLKRRREERAYSNVVLAEILASKQVGLIYNAAEAAVKLDEKVLVPELIGALYTPVRSTFITEDRPTFPVIGRSPPGLARGPNPATKSDKAPGSPGAGEITRPRRQIIPGGSHLIASSYGVVHPWSAKTALAGPTAPADRTKQTGTIHVNLSGPNPFSIGPTGSRPSIQVIETTYRNEPVLEALRALTGKDFEYDVDVWIDWWKKEGRKVIGDRELPPPPENSKQAVITEEATADDGR